MPLPFGGLFLGIGARFVLDRIFPKRVVRHAHEKNPVERRVVVTSGRANKAVAAILTAVVAVIGLSTGVEVQGVPVEGIAAVITPLLVYWIPNWYD